MLRDEIFPVKSAQGTGSVPLADPEASARTGLSAAEAAAEARRDVGTLTAAAAAAEAPMAETAPAVMPQPLPEVRAAPQFYGSTSTFPASPAALTRSVTRLPVMRGCSDDDYLQQTRT